MNLVFVSVLIFSFLIPGFIFRLCYFSSPFSKKFLAVNIVTDLTWSIIPGVLIQFLGILFVENCTKYIIRLDYVGSLLLVTNDKALAGMIFLNIHDHIFQILWYNLSLIIVGVAAGFLLKSIVRYCKLDRRFRLFRFSNKWYYILSGECLDFPHINDKFEDINLRLVDLLCQTGNEEHIYIGELFDWYLDDKGDLESLHLRYPMRRKLSEDKQTADKYYKIPSRYLIIPYKNIININVRYYDVKVTPKNPSD